MRTWRQKARYEEKNHRIVRFQANLKINGLLQQNSEFSLNECLNEIVKLFGGIQSLLRFILNNCEFDKIDSIYQIARKISIQSNNSLKINTILNYFKTESDKNNPIKFKLNLFNLIPNESITNICSFLNKKK
eukprot:99415_1